MIAEGVLVIGFGNALRGDDAVGRRAAEVLADGRLPGARVEARHQLTPELAADIADAGLVVLIDASVDDGAPGDLRVERVVGRRQSLGSHAVDATGIVALAEDLYGQAPAVFLVSVCVERLELGTDLSPAAAAALPRLVDAVAAVVDSHRPTPTRGA